MWIAPDGRTITNAWADPSVPLPQSVKDLIASLGAGEQQALAGAIQDDLAHSYDEIETFARNAAPEREAEFAELWIEPDALAHLRARTVEELRAEVAALDIRWRLDAYLLLEDALPDLT